MSTIDRNSLVGLWKLKSIQFEAADTGEIADVFGPNPSGYSCRTDLINYALVVGREQPMSAHGTFETCLAGLTMSVVRGRPEVASEASGQLLTQLRHSTAWTLVA